MIRGVRGVVKQSYTYLLWLGIFIAVVLFNKWLLEQSGFPFPFELKLWQIATFGSFVGIVVMTRCVHTWLLGWAPLVPTSSSHSPTLWPWPLQLAHFARGV